MKRQHFLTETLLHVLDRIDVKFGHLASVEVVEAEGEEMAERRGTFRLSRICKAIEDRNETEIGWSR